MSASDKSKLDGFTLDGSGNLGLGDTSPDGKLSIIPGANEKAIVVSGGSLTGANTQSLVDLSTTWNTTGDTTAFKMNITNTSTGPNSRLLDLQLDNNSIFYVDRYGYVGSYAFGTVGWNAGTSLGGKIIDNTVHPSVLIGNGSNNFTGTSGTWRLLKVGSGTNDKFAPISGTASMIYADVTPTVNTTGTYAGETTAFRISQYSESTTGVTSNLLLDVGNNTASSGGGTHISRLAVTAAGNVGIGTKSPEVRLQVQGSTASTLPFELATSDYVSGTTGSSLGIGFGATTGNTYSRIQAHATGSTVAADLALNAAGGDVGIGTTTPEAKLDLAGGVLPADGSTKALKVTGTIASPTSLSHASQLNVSTSGAAAGLDVHAMNITMGAGLTGSNRVSGLQIINNVAGTGNGVGWGDLGNYGLLTRTEPTTTGSNAGVSGWAANGSANYGLAGAALTDKAGAKNIGVWGQAQNSTGYAIGGYFSLSNDGTAGSGSNSGALVASNGSTTSAIFVALDNTSPVMTVADGGNVGIGSTTPDKPLSVSAPSSEVQPLRLHRQTNTNGGVIGLLYSANDSGDAVQSYASTSGVIESSTAGAENGAFIISTVASGASNERVRVTSAGNVGIGIDNPDHRLEIEGTGNDTTSAGVEIGNPTDGTAAGAKISLRSGTADASSGFVGAFSAAYTSSSFYSDRMVVGAGTAATGLTLAAPQPSQDVRIVTDSQERVRVTSAGNLGIGADDPSTKLDVNGAVTVRGMAAPTVSPADQGRIYFDSTSKKYRVSEDGGAYVDLVPASSSIKTVSARLTNNGTTCGIAAEIGAWIDSAARAGTGLCNLTLTSGFFSSAPACTCTVNRETGGFNGICGFLNPSDTTQLEISTEYAGNVQVDIGFEIICVGT
jgi:hypothetical protein